MVHLLCMRKVVSIKLSPQARYGILMVSMILVTNKQVLLQVLDLLVLAQRILCYLLQVLQGILQLILKLRQRRKIALQACDDICTVQMFLAKHFELTLQVIDLHLQYIMRLIQAVSSESAAIQSQNGHGINDCHADLLLIVPMLLSSRYC